MLINLMITEEDAKRLKRKIKDAKTYSNTKKEAVARAFIQMFGKTPKEYKRIIIFKL